MQYSNIFVIIYFVGTFYSLAIDLILGISNYKNRQKNGLNIPPELSEYITNEDAKNTRAYRNEKFFLSIPNLLISTVAGVVLMVSGFYPALYNFFLKLTSNVYLTTLLFCVCASIPLSLLSLPFELYAEFKIEKKYGFSKMTLRMWIMDQVKSLVVSAVIAVPLLCAVVALASHLSAWWIPVAIVYVAFSLAASVVYPLRIAPLFNKFTPLEDGELKSRITVMLEKCGFKSSGVFVMDASKRSGHSNAYFTGLGKSRRVVLYDTLIAQLSVDELCAVLGHELGHYKKHHITKRLAIMIPLVFVLLFAVCTVAKIPALYVGFGFDGSQASLMQFIGIFLTAQVFGGFASLSGLCSNYFSRRDEYQADSFARELCGGGQSLCSALIKLNKENKSDLVPSKLYSVFNYSHPTLLERIENLTK